MAKHTFMMLILFFGISIMVSGQTDTISTTSNNTKGLKWFIDCGTCGMLDSHNDDENIRLVGFFESFSAGLSIGANSVRVQDGLISPVVYGGNAYKWSIFYEGTNHKFYWRHTCSFSLGRGKISPIKLNSSLNREDYALSYKPSLIDFQGALRLKKSPHYLGVYVSIENFSIADINSDGPLNQNLADDIIDEVNNDGYFAGITYLYFNEIYDIPFRTQVLLSVLKTSVYPYGNSQFVDFSHTFKIDFMLNKKQNGRWMIGYTWNIFNQNKDDKFYRTIKSSSSLSLSFAI